MSDTQAVVALGAFATTATLFSLAVLWGIRRSRR